MHYDLWSIIQIKLIMPTETLAVGFHWLGDRAKQVILIESSGLTTPPRHMLTENEKLTGKLFSQFPKLINHDFSGT